jgi:hypothetical protein
MGLRKDEGVEFFQSRAVKFGKKRQPCDEKRK